MDRCIFVYKKNYRDNLEGRRCVSRANNLYCFNHSKHYKANLFNSPGLMVLFEAGFYKPDHVEKLLNF